VGGQWRLGANETAAAFEAFQQRGFLATDVGAGADSDFEIEAVAAAIAAFIASTACGYSERM
jgi:hypothetical protein